jgi:hypothetical protein
LTGWLLWRAGVWEKFWWWTMTYSRVYAGATGWKYGFEGLVGFFPGIKWDCLVWIVALAGLAGLLTGKGSADKKFFLLSLLGASAIAVSCGWRFTSHYFVMMLPAVSLLAGDGVAAAAGRLSGNPYSLVRASPWMLFAMVWLWVAWDQQIRLGAFFAGERGGEYAPLDLGNHFQVYPAIGEYIQTHSPPTATVAVIGSEPEVLFYAHRRPATGYVYMYDLVRDQPFRERMEEDMMAEVERARPDFIIFVTLQSSWLPLPSRLIDRIENWVLGYTHRYYEPIGVATLSPRLCIWGREHLRHVPVSQQFVIVYERKRR